MNAILHAHIPSLKMDEREVDFGEGTLKRLGFEEWQALDTEFEFADRKFAKAEPVFWVQTLSLDVGPTSEALSRAASSAARRIHTAFLLVGAPLIPTPELSCCYVTFPASGATLPFIGPMEREFIVYGAPLSYRYQAENLAVVAHVHRATPPREARHWDGEIEAAIDVLEETARPDSWYRGDLLFSRLHGFVRCMAAAENLLMSADELEADGEITSTFGQRAATLLIPVADDRSSVAKHFSDLYRFRTALVHGRAIPDEADPSVVARLQGGRQLLADIVMGRIGLAEVGRD